MANSKKHLLIEQTDRKLQVFKAVETAVVPPLGWINTIRKSLNMSMRQMGNRLNVSAQSIKEMEARESNGSITIKSLSEAANSLDMRLVYGFIPKQDSIEKMIEERAMAIAKDIVMRTHHTMKLEDQENTDERLQKAIRNRANEIITKMPKYLWD